MQNTPFFASFYAFSTLMLMLGVSLTATMFVTIVVRRVMMSVLDYQGRPMLLASVAISTLVTAAFSLAVKHISGDDWSNAPVIITVVSGVAVAAFLLNRADAPGP